MKPKRVAETEHRREFTLLENCPLRLTNAKGCRVNCVSGVVLITAYNEPEDFELRPADVFVVPNNGLTLVEGIGRCYVRVDLPCPEPHPLYRLLQMTGLVQLQQRLTGLRGSAVISHPKRSRH
jgi:hypothetical protein